MYAKCLVECAFNPSELLLLTSTNMKKEVEKGRKEESSFTFNFYYMLGAL